MCWIVLVLVLGNLCSPGSALQDQRSLPKALYQAMLPPVPCVGPWYLLCEHFGGRAQDRSLLLPPGTNFYPDTEPGDEFQDMSYSHSLGHSRK